MQYVIRFYLQMFTGVHCGFLVSRGRYTTCKRFCPKSYESCLHLWSQLLLLSVSVNLPNLQEQAEQKLYLNHIPTQKSLGMLNQDVVVTKLSFHHVQSKQSPCV